MLGLKGLKGVFQDLNVVLFWQEGFASVLCQTALSIMDKGGVVRKMENLGEQELPHRMRAHTEWHTHGRYVGSH